MRLRVKIEKSTSLTLSLSSPRSVGCSRTLLLLRLPSLLFSITPTESPSALVPSPPPTTPLPAVSLLNLLCDAGKTSYGLNFLTVPSSSLPSAPLPLLYPAVSQRWASPRPLLVAQCVPQHIFHLTPSRLQHKRSICPCRFQEPVYWEKEKGKNDDNNEEHADPKVFGRLCFPPGGCSASLGI